MKVVVFGASGVVGRAATEHWVELGADVIGVSRRHPGVDGARHEPVDLADDEISVAALAASAFDGTEVVVFAALQESPDLLSGWFDPGVMAHNLRLFRNALEPLASRTTLRHVTLLQGAKAYGLHLGRTPVPGKERAPRDDHENFYWLQEDALRSLAAEHGWGTILRPQVVYGESLASPMNLLPVIGTYAAVERAAGRPLSFPGGPPAVQEAVDARLLARAIAWSAQTPAAVGQLFNITNGDVFAWQDVWPTIADALGMELGEPAPQRLAHVMPSRSEEWAAVVDRHRLQAPRRLDDFVGTSWIYADVLFGALASRPVPGLLSTIKIRQAGFSDCIDTEDMFREWFARLQDHRLLPSR